MTTGVNQLILDIFHLSVEVLDHIVPITVMKCVTGDSHDILVGQMDGSPAIKVVGFLEEIIHNQLSDCNSLLDWIYADQDCPFFSFAGVGQFRCTHSNCCRCPIWIVNHVFRGAEGLKRD